MFTSKANIFLGPFRLTLAQPEVAWEGMRD